MPATESASGNPNTCSMLASHTKAAYLAAPLEHQTAAPEKVMTQYTDKRPRVAAIGLDDVQEASLEHLCGTFRSAASVSNYLREYSWKETDITVIGHLWPPGIVVRGHLLAAGISQRYEWKGYSLLPTGLKRTVSRNVNNTERELRIPEDCPERYRHLATELATQLRILEDPPAIFRVKRTDDDSVLVETTSGRPVALRYVINDIREVTTKSKPPVSTVALAIPEVTDLSAWFQAFLGDVHELDPGSVPQPPTRFRSASVWYTQEERTWAQRLAKIQAAVEQLQDEHQKAKAQLVAASERANAGIRRCLWSDGDDLEEAIGDILKELGFDVRYMDTETRPGDPKREDLRLTIPDLEGWEAIAEVKGYPAGTKTNDARQIREYRDLYIREVGRLPDLTLWIANTFKLVEDPSSRPPPGNDVGQKAADVGSVHILAADLYRLWALVQTGSLEQAQARQLLIDTDPGLWSPPAPAPENAGTARMPLGAEPRIVITTEDTGIGVPREGGAAAVTSPN